MPGIPILTYFPIRGRAEPIRMILIDNEIDYEEVSVALSEWPAIRPSLPFKEMPKLEIHDITIVQSRAICRYLARKLDLYGQSEADRIRCDIMDEALKDAEHELGGLFWDKDFVQKKEKFLRKKIPQRLQNLQDYLDSYSHDEKYCVGKEISYVDYLMWNYLDWVRAFAPGLLNQFTQLNKIKQSVEQRIKIQTYIQAGRQATTITVPIAKFGGTVETS